MRLDPLAGQVLRYTREIIQLNGPVGIGAFSEARHKRSRNALFAVVHAKLAQNNSVCRRRAS